MTVDMSTAAVTARLREVSQLSDLRAENRMNGKIDYSPDAVTARLREVFRLTELCVALGRHRLPGDREPS